jgi:hypothetical protein
MAKYKVLFNCKGLFTQKEVLTNSNHGAPNKLLSKKVDT